MIGSFSFGRKLGLEELHCNYTSTRMELCIKGKLPGVTMVLGAILMDIRYSGGSVYAEATKYICPFVVVTPTSTSGTWIPDLPKSCLR